jgi:hypothetical protein
MKRDRLLGVLPSNLLSNDRLEKVIAIFSIVVVGKKQNKFEIVSGLIHV